MIGVVKRRMTKVVNNDSEEGTHEGKNRQEGSSLK